MGDYRVKFAPGELFPESEQWAICRSADATVLYLREDMSALAQDVQAKILESAWAGFRSLVEEGEADIAPCAGWMDRP